MCVIEDASSLGALLDKDYNSFCAQCTSLVHFEHSVHGEAGSPEGERTAAIGHGSGKPAEHCGARTPGCRISIFFQAKVVGLAFNFLTFLLYFSH